MTRQAVKLVWCNDIDTSDGICWGIVGASEEEVKGLSFEERAFQAQPSAYQE